MGRKDMMAQPHKHSNLYVHKALQEKYRGLGKSWKQYKKVSEVRAPEERWQDWTGGSAEGEKWIDSEDF